MAVTCPNCVLFISCPPVIHPALPDDAPARSSQEEGDQEHGRDVPKLILFISSLL
jgi:hypothetical protein